METLQDIHTTFKSFRESAQVRVLHDALDYMEQSNSRSKGICIAMAMGYTSKDGIRWERTKPLKLSDFSY